MSQRDDATGHQAYDRVQALEQRHQADWNKVYPQDEAASLVARHCDEARALAYQLARELDALRSEIAAPCELDGCALLHGDLKTQREIHDKVAARSAKGPTRDELKKIFPLLWHINDHLRITPDQAVAYSGSTNDVDRLRDVLHYLDPQMDLGTDHEGMTYEDWLGEQGGIGVARSGLDV